MAHFNEACLFYKFNNSLALQHTYLLPAVPQRQFALQQQQRLLSSRDETNWKHSRRDAILGKKESTNLASFARLYLLSTGKFHTYYKTGKLPGVLADERDGTRNCRVCHWCKSQWHINSILATRMNFWRYDQWSSGEITNIFILQSFT